MEIYLLLFFILILAIFLGLELISKIPSTLHTPLMSGANAISGITLVGALTLQTDGTLQMVLAFCAIAFGILSSLVLFLRCLWLVAGSSQSSSSFDVNLQSGPSQHGLFALRKKSARHIRSLGALEEGSSLQSDSYSITAVASIHIIRTIRSKQ